MRVDKRPRRDPNAASPLKASRAARVAALLCACVAAGCTAGTPFEDSGPAPKAAAVAAEPVDEMSTGSIKPASEQPLDHVLARADHAAVLTALGAALDPQGAGGAVTWTAAGGQGRGEARPTATARMEGDEICRAFALDGAGLDGKFAAAGTACRNKRGDWRVKALTPGKAG